MLVSSLYITETQVQGCYRQVCNLHTTLCNGSNLQHKLIVKHRLKCSATRAIVRELLKERSGLFCNWESQNSHCKGSCTFSSDFNFSRTASSPGQTYSTTHQQTTKLLYFDTGYR